MPVVRIIAAVALFTAALLAAGAFWVEAVVIRRSGASIGRALWKKPRPKGAAAPVSPSQRIKQEGFAWLKGQNAARVTISSREGLKLCGYYLPAQNPNGRCALLIHGYRGAGGREETGWLSRAYHRMGFNVLMPDNRAHGESEGRYLGMGWLDSDDCARWIDYLVKTQPDAQILLHGVSMGAAAAIMACAKRPPAAVRGVVADSCFSCLYEVLRLKAHRSLRIPAEPLMPAADLWNRLRHGYSFRQVSPAAAIKAIGVPILLIHGAEDTLVPPEMAQILYEAAPAKKELWLAPGAGHAEAYAVDPSGYEKKLWAFAERVLK